MLQPTHFLIYLLPFILSTTLIFCTKKTISSHLPKTSMALECPDEIHKKCDFKNESKNESDSNSFCSCDKTQCWKSGSCCVNSESDNWIRNSYLDCVTTHQNNGQIYSYIIVGRCPISFPNEIVRDQCEASEDSIREDRFLALPVTSFKTNLTFRNFYCGLCHQETRISLVPWRVLVKCNESFDSYQGKPINNCENVFYMPSPKGIHLRHPGTCGEGLVAWCSRDWVDEISVKNKSQLWITLRGCSTTLAPVQLISNNSRTNSSDEGSNYNSKLKLYKNEDCAFCNNVPLEDLQCPSQKIINRLTYKFFYKPTTSRVSFSLLLDIDFREGAYTVGYNKKCPPSYVYDPWMNECRSLTCGKHFFLFEGSCLPIGDFHNHTIVEGSAINVSCSTTVYDHSGDYFIDDNGTLFLHAPKDLSFPWGKYEMIGENNESIVVCLPEEVKTNENVAKFGDSQSYLTVVAIAISLLFLLLKLFSDFCFGDHSKISSKVVTCLAVTLFLAQFLFIAGVGQTSLPYIPCAMIGILTHFCFLASFAWTTILAYDIWKTFSSMMVISAKNDKFSASGKRFSIYCSTAFGLPLLIVSISTSMDFLTSHNFDFRPQYGEVICWFSNKRGLLLFFGCPLAILLLLNITLFVSTAFYIRRTAKEAQFSRENSPRHENRISYLLYIKLALIMGLTWIFGFVAAYSNNDVIWHIFILLNCLQGVFIFFAFTSLRGIRHSLRISFRCLSMFSPGSGKKLGPLEGSSTESVKTSTTRANSLTGTRL